MTKLDVTNFPREFDQLSAAAANARQRRIMEIVRRHYILELVGRTDEIFAPDMTVEQPVYYLNFNDTSATLRGREQVMTFYRSVESVPIACEAITHAVSDAGYWAECWFNFYVPGAALGLEPEACYVRRQWISMYWPFDDRALLIGERIYEHAALREVVRIEPAQALTMADVQDALLPLLRPLSAYP